LINFPDGAEDGDKLQVSLESAYRADVTFIAGTSFADQDRQSAEMYINANMSIGYPYKVYLTAVSSGEEAAEVGDFRFNVRYEKYDPNKTDSSGSGDDSNVIVVRNNTYTTTVVEKSLWESEDFLLIVYIAGGALALIIILICCLVCLRSKQKNIERISNLNTDQLDGSPGPQSKPIFVDDQDGNNQIIFAGPG